MFAPSLKTSASLNIDSLTVSACHCRALLCQEDCPAGPVVWQELPEKKEVCLLCVAKFCLGCTQRETSPSNFSIHGENWSSVFIEEEAVTGTHILVERRQRAATIYISIKFFEGKTVVLKLQFQGGSDLVYFAHFLPAQCSHTSQKFIKHFWSEKNLRKVAFCKVFSIAGFT